VVIDPSSHHSIHWRFRYEEGICPKCNSTEVYTGDQSPLRAGDGLVHLEAYAPKRAPNILLDAYLCINCGYTEMYVASGNMEKLMAVKEDPKTWHKVAG
jgi:predicted nucleic-acid-binding Zn-ribbon protein